MYNSDPLRSIFDWALNGNPSALAFFGLALAAINMIRNVDNSLSHNEPRTAVAAGRAAILVRYSDLIDLSKQMVSVI